MARTKPASSQEALLLADRNSLYTGAVTAMLITQLCQKHFMAAYHSAHQVLASSHMIWVVLKQQHQQIFIRDGVHSDAFQHTAACMVQLLTEYLGHMMMKHAMYCATM